MAKTALKEDISECFIVNMTFWPSISVIFVPCKST